MDERAYLLSDDHEHDDVVRRESVGNRILSKTGLNQPFYTFSLQIHVLFDMSHFLNSMNLFA